MSSTTDTAPASCAVAGVNEPRLFRVGSLQYTQRELYVLFFWLMWNDFMIMLLEQPGQFGSLLQLANGATYTQISIFATLATLLTFWINPVFSTWSDRTRTPWGRRRPFLFFTTPPLGLLIMVVPYMPTLHHYLMRYSWAVAFFRHVPMNGSVFMLGVVGLLLAISNAIVLAIFSYLYWDVVPVEVLGRFTSLAKIVTAVLTIGWNFFFLGMAQTHMKAVCVGIALFALTAYLISVWKVKEGDYPPPDTHTKGGMLAPLRAYFVECYSEPYYLWIFFGLAAYGLSNASGILKTHYVMFDLHLSWDVVGKINSAPQVIAIFLGFFFGSITDRFQPVRAFPPTYVAWGLACLGSYFFITGAWSYLVWNCVTQVAIFANGVTYGALLPQIYPREKLGQFCSAAVLFQSATGFILGIPLGILFDYVHSDRLAYLWSAIFLFLAAAIFFKVERNYRARHGRAPVPHAG
jgi:maltose/moltooligosaccharide transporter